MNIRADIAAKVLENSRLANICFELGAQILKKRCIEIALGVSASQDDQSLIDQSWLQFALQHATLSLQGCQSLEDDRFVSLQPPVSLEDCPEWHTNNKSVSEFLRSNVSTQNIPKEEAEILLPKKLPFRARIVAWLTLFMNFVQLYVFKIKTTTVTVSLYNNETSRFWRLSWRKYRLNGWIPLDDIQFLDRRPTIIDFVLRDRFQAEILKVLLEGRLSLPGISSEKLASFLSKAIPVSHFEQRLMNFKSAVNIAKKIPVERLVQATALYYSSSASFLIAAYKSQGTKIIGIQHGGYYGYQTSHQYALAVEAVGCDKFISWGWTNWNYVNPILDAKIPCKVLPIGSFHLQKCRKIAPKLRRRRETKNVLLCISGGIFDERIRSDFVVDRKLAKEYMWQDNFSVLAAFAKKYNLKVDVKVTPSQWREEMLESLKANFDGMDLRFEIFNKNNAAWKHFHKYDLILWDTIGTGFFESVQMGYPTLLLPSADYVPLRSDKDYISEKFFAKTLLSESLDIQETFEAALRESSLFLETFGKAAETPMNCIEARQPETELSYSMEGSV
jgi:hypothetical protein